MLLSKHKAWLKLAEMFEPGKRLPTLSPSGLYLSRGDLNQRVGGVCIGTLYLSTRGWISKPRELEMDRDLRLHFKPPKSHHGYFWPPRTHRKERATMCGFMAAIAGRRHE
ncbi:hypothetical protein LCGC14_1204090 [marine sediment metagenome]|uniref:Uncharacterized protein n=1 Tax=marine sediment metagenome TaxID=412755 RepID=A0A0F9NYF9_9ZZZZ